MRAGLSNSPCTPCKYAPVCYPDWVVTTWRDAGRRLEQMFSLMVMGILGGLTALVAYEIYQEVRGSSEALHDRYHE